MNETAGTVAIKIDRTGSNVGTTTADVTLSTASGLPICPTRKTRKTLRQGETLARRATRRPTYAVHFAVGQTSAIVNVPLINVKTFADTRSFTASLSGPSTGRKSSLPLRRRSRSPITRCANSHTPNPNGLTTYSSGVEINGPFYINSFTNLVSSPQGSLFYSSMPVITFGVGFFGISHQFHGEHGR